MNKNPFFSILLPTKNRSKIIPNAINSVLRQTFDNYELIIVDNSDDNSTERLVNNKYKDSRISYIRTGGLSMPDNWQYALCKAKGEYITFLTDRMMFSSKYSLGKVFTNLTTHDAKIVSWMWGGYNEKTGDIWTFNKYNNRSYFVKNKDFIKSYLLGDQEWHHHRMPKGLHSCINRTYLEELKNKYGNICLPVSPDYSMGLITCLHFFEDYTLHIDTAILLSGFYVPSISNGSGAFEEYDKNISYLSSFSKKLSIDDIYSKTLLKNHVQINLLFYDLFNAVEITKKDGIISWKNVNLVFYFFENYKQILKLRNNPHREEWLEDFEFKLSLQEMFIRDEVNRKIKEYNAATIKNEPSIFTRGINFLRRKLSKKKLINSATEDLKYDALPFLETYDNDQYNEYCKSLINF